MDVDTDEDSAAATAAAAPAAEASALPQLMPAKRLREADGAFTELPGAGARDSNTLPCPDSLQRCATS